MSHIIQPCPVCGSADIVEPTPQKNFRGLGSRYWWMECRNCSTHVAVDRDSIEDLLREWNNHPKRKKSGKGGRR